MTNFSEKDSNESSSKRPTWMVILTLIVILALIVVYVLSFV